jgi:hypothetical protein
VRLLQCVAERGEGRPDGGELFGGDGGSEQLIEALTKARFRLGYQRGSTSGEADQRRASVGWVREPGDPSVRLEPIHDLADGADPGGEVRGDVTDARSRMVSQDFVAGQDGDGGIDGRSRRGSPIGPSLARRVIAVW